MSQISQAVVFIDTNVDDLRSLVNGVLSGINVQLLAADSDGIVQITDYLRKQPTQTIHIVSHGAPGVLYLGSTQLDLDNLEKYTSALQSWFWPKNSKSKPQHSAPNLLLYGCNVAAGDAGEEFITKLHHLTGAIISASRQVVGNPQLGGHWVLNYQVGLNSQNSEKIAPIPLAFSQAIVADYSHVFALPGARSATAGEEVFLGGNYIELGISGLGDYGTLGAKPGDFFGTNARSNIGMSADFDGFGEGNDLKMDYFLPGSPEERWVVGYKLGDSTFTGSNSALEGPSDIPTSVSNTSSGNTLSAVIDSTFNSALKIDKIVSFDVNDKFFKTQITLTNISGSALNSVRYMRSFDPDNTVDLGGDYETVNTVIGTIAEDGYAAVEAKTPGAGDPVFDATGSLAPIVLYSNDPRAVASYFGFANTNPYAEAAYDLPPEKGVADTDDIGITLTFDVGALAAGASTSFTYYTSLDNREFSEVIDDIPEEPTDQPPYLDLPTDEISLDNGESVVIASDLILFDADGGTIDGATVSIGDGFNASEEALGILGQAGSSGTVNGLNWEYDSDTGILIFAGVASAEDYQLALRQVTFISLTNDPTGLESKEVQFAIGSQLANPENGHFYEFITNRGITWTAAKAEAEQRSFFGLQGYLVTVTSEFENDFVTSKLQGLGWLGASDADVEGEWRWATGPETGQLFWSGSSTGGPVDGRYNGWAPSEPNDWGSGEDYGHFYANGTWNDFANTTTVDGYVVEYGGTAGDPELNLIDSVTVTVNRETNMPPTGSVTLAGTILKPCRTLTANTDTVADADGLGEFSYEWQQSPTGSGEWTTIVADGSNTLTLTEDQIGYYMRAVVRYTDGGGTLEEVFGTPTASPVERVYWPDFGGDGSADIVWHHHQAGQNSLWLMDGTRLDTGMALNNVDLGWELRAIGNFNDDCHPDLVWRHNGSGQTVLWLMEDYAIGEGLFLETVDPVWQVEAAADFNQDGEVDILWRHKTSGQNVVWLMEDTELTGAMWLETVASPDWEVGAVGDFTQDGNLEIVWRHRTAGTNVVWFLEGDEIVESTTLPSVDAGWDMVGAADFTQDGRLDILWRHRTAGANVVWDMEGLEFRDSVILSTAQVGWTAVI